MAIFRRLIILRETYHMIDSAITISTSFMWLERSGRVTSTRSIRSLFIYHGEISHAHADATDEFVSWW